jgi:hypothetical protein
MTRLHVTRESVIQPNIEGAIDGVGTDTVTFRYLEPGEGAVRTDGDVLRMQCLHRARINADDISVASDHGRELLDYVLADLAEGTSTP